MNKELIVLVLFLVFCPGVSASDTIDCSEAYASKAARCEQIACTDRYKTFIGIWEGPFESYDRSIKGFRPYRNQVTYSERDCLQNLETGEIFIIGRKTDTYPAFKGLPSKVQKGLLITGRIKAEEGMTSGKPFLRTIDAENGLVNYELAFMNIPAEMSIWKTTVPPSNDSPQMVFQTIDSRDMTAARLHKRLVTVTLQVGSEQNPQWQGVIARGYHSLKRTTANHP